MAALPDWCEPLYDAPLMRAIDRWAIDEQGVASLELMERAGEGVARLVEEIVPDGPVAVVCGKGNNGGDGLVVARLLRHAAREVAVISLGEPRELSPDARANLERLPGRPVLGLGSADAQMALERALGIVDAILGTGFEGAPRGAAAEAIEAIEAAPGQVVSVDVPSGVDASSGVVSGVAVHAAATATFHAGKVGLWVHPGKAHAGEAVTVDIGVPRGVPVSAQSGLIDGRVLELLPRRLAASTKFSSGHVVVVGGSSGLMGAPAMASLAAMRAGAGYVTACVPASERRVLDAQLLETMTRALPDERGALSPDGVKQVLAALERADSLALGPGLGRDSCSAQFARELASHADVPTVIDAVWPASPVAAPQPCSRRTPASWRGCCRARAQMSSANGLHAPARRRRRRAPWWCSRGTTRWWYTRTVAWRSVAAAARHLRRRAPATC
jgi:NAD(P)H-hydrate epimerase